MELRIIARTPDTKESWLSYERCEHGKRILSDHGGEVPFFTKRRDDLCMRMMVMVSKAR